MGLSLRTRINLALAAGGALLLVFGIASYVTIEAFLRDARAERASNDAVLLLERTVSQLKAAESSQRKFLITADADDLKAYQSSSVQVMHALARLRGAVVTAEGQRQMEALDGLVRRRLASMEVTVRARQQTGLGAASQLVSSDLNRVLRADIDSLVERVKSAEVAEVSASRSDTEAGAQSVKRLIAAAGLLALLLLAWSIYLVNLYAVRRGRAEARLAETIAQLERVGSQLRASESQMRQVLDTVPVLFGYVDAQQRFRFHNRAYEEAMGRRADEIEGHTLREVLGGPMYENVRHHIERAFAGYPVTYERSQRRPDGSVRDYEMHYYPRYGEGEASGVVIGVYAMASDITDFKRIDRMKSDFVSTVSHELRTPLTSIRGSLGLIAGGLAGPLPEKARSLVEVARDNCERLVRLVNDILDIEKLEAGQMPLHQQPAMLRPLLEKAVADNAGFAAQHEVTIGCECETDVAASVDTDRFLQVVTNLLSNAIRFSPRGAAVRLRLLRDAGQARVEVTDTGPGIPPEFRGRIFQKFSQADASTTRQKSGSGLGLSISKALVERMGGRIDYRTAAGSTTFFVEFPEVQGVAGAVVNAGEAA